MLLAASDQSQLGIIVLAAEWMMFTKKAPFLCSNFSCLMISTYSKTAAGTEDKSLDSLVYSLLLQVLHFATNSLKAETACILTDSVLYRQTVSL